MFTRLSILCSAALLAFGGLARAATLPAPSVDYSADRVIESEAGTFTGKVYAAGGNERTEMSMGEMQSVTILSREQKKGWVLMPMQKMYSEMDLAQAQQQSGAAPQDQVEITEVGAETVEGFEATKYKMMMKDGTAGGFIWITRDGIPVKMDMLSKDGRKKSRITMTLKNLQIGPQDPQLFQVPAGYSAMPSMGGFGMGKPSLGGAIKGALLGGR